jgi:hypothetical protein
MLFRRQAYDTIGGHAALHDVIVEDVSWPRQIRGTAESALRARHRPAGVRMYSSFAALWEGGRKTTTWARRKFAANVLSAFYHCHGVCHALGGAAGELTVTLLNPRFSWPTAILYGLTALTLAGYGLLRWLSYRQVGVPLRYWWLSSVAA